MMAAAMFKSPELALNQVEADALAGAIAEVEKHYSVSVSPETRAWLGLGAAVAMIYGPRAYMIAKRRKETRGSQSRPQVPATVSEPAMTGGATPTEGGPPAAQMSAADFGL